MVQQMQQTIVNPNSTSIPIGKYKKNQIPSVVKQLVWDKYIGEYIGKTKCYCCKLVDIKQSSFYCGHVVAEKNGGTMEIDNLRPICKTCNSSMGTTNMHEFMTTYKI